MVGAAAGGHQVHERPARVPGLQVPRPGNGIAVGKRQAVQVVAQLAVAVVDDPSAVAVGDAVHRRQRAEAGGHAGDLGVEFVADHHVDGRTLLDHAAVKIGGVGAADHHHRAGGLLEAHEALVVGGDGRGGGLHEDRVRPQPPGRRQCAGHVQILDHRIDVGHLAAGRLKLGRRVGQEDRILQKLVRAVLDDPVLAAGAVALARPGGIDDQYAHGIQVRSVKC